MLARVLDGIAALRESRFSEMARSRARPRSMGTFRLLRYRKTLLRLPIWPLMRATKGIHHLGP